MSVPTLTLLELNKSIKKAIDVSFDSPVWIIAEINNITLHRSGHCYLEFIQKAKDSDKIIAQARGTIWSTQYRFISSYFQSVTNTNIDKGINVLVQVSVDFHEIYGFSLNVRDIDPSYTLGDLERRKKEIIEKLISEGVFDMNRELMLPSVIQRIAVISSLGAAGYEDFLNQLSSNKYGYSFSIELFEADMQGSNTESSVIKALNDVFNNSQSYDIVAIIRGGGSKTDLSYFDNYNIAYHITQFPLPVISGIGHDRDESVTDMVSHTKLKTPTAVANYIIDYNLIFENDVQDCFQEIINHTKDIIKTNEMYLTGMSLGIMKIKDKLTSSIENCNRLYYRLKNSSNNLIKDNSIWIDSITRRLYTIPSSIISSEKKELDRNINRLIKIKSQYFYNQGKEIEVMEQRIRLIDPKNILKRGFSITQISDKTINSDTKIVAGDNLKTILFDKIIFSKIKKHEKNK
ncbi:MAG: exodeoxyribonuclease VII large subunit [Bacteroidales bacterium]|nr:exodeoxyribonuclease VII large subunit [Bacteroidales bacterium]